MEVKEEKKEINDLEELRKIEKGKLIVLEQEVAQLIAQRNKIEARLNEINIAALKIHGKVELLVQMINNGQSKTE